MSETDQREYHPFKSAEARDRYLAFYDRQASQWPISSENRTVETDDGTTFVRVGGSEGAPPLVLLPGSRASSICWISMIEALSGRYRTYAIDAIYDVGRSVDSRPIKTAADATGWLDGLLDALGLSDGVNLMGLSLGGWLAGEYVSPARRIGWRKPFRWLLRVSFSTSPAASSFAAFRGRAQSVRRLHALAHAGRRAVIGADEEAVRGRRRRRGSLGRVLRDAANAWWRPPKVR